MAQVREERSRRRSDDSVEQRRTEVAEEIQIAYV